MIRVFFRLQQISLRLKQTVDIQAILKKQTDTITFQTKPKLINQIAHFNQMVEFFITAQKPTFQIIIVMLLKDVKKYIGMYEINIQQWQQNANNDIVQKIKKCPDSTATISFSFMYMKCLDGEMDRIKTNKKLIELRQMSAKKCEEEMRQTQNTNKQLLNQNKKLNKQLLKVKQQNQTIKQQSKHLKKEHALKCNNLSQRIKQKQRDTEAHNKDMKNISEQLQLIKQYMCSSYTRHNNSNVHQNMSMNNENNIKMGEIMHLISQALSISRQMKNKKQKNQQPYKEKEKLSIRAGGDLGQEEIKKQKIIDFNRNNLQLYCKLNQQDIEQLPKLHLYQSQMQEQ